MQSQTYQIWKTLGERVHVAGVEIRDSAHSAHRIGSDIMWGRIRLSSEMYQQATFLSVSHRTLCPHTTQSKGPPQ